MTQNCIGCTGSYRSEQAKGEKAKMKRNVVSSSARSPPVSLFVSKEAEAFFTKR